METMAEVLTTSQVNIPLLFSARQPLDVQPKICSECGDVCEYAEHVIHEATEGEADGCYIYRRSPCECERLAEEARVAREAEEQREVRSKALLIASRVDDTPKTARMNLAGFREQPGNADAIKAAKLWFAGWPQTRGLVFYGENGRGKTHLAVGIIRGMARRLVRAEFWQTYALLETLRTRSEFEETAPRFTLDRFARLPLLALDDLGKEKLTDWGKEQIFHLIDQRDLHERPTIVTTNKSPEGLASHAGEAVVSRLLGNSDWIALTGVDHRYE